MINGPTESCQKLSNSVSADEVDDHVDLDSIVVSAPVIGAPLRSDISGEGVAQTVTDHCAPHSMLIASCPLHTRQVCNHPLGHN